MIVCQISNRIFWRATVLQPIITQDHSETMAHRLCITKHQYCRKRPCGCRESNQGMFYVVFQQGQLQICSWVFCFGQTWGHRIISWLRGLALFRFSGDKNTSENRQCLIATYVCAINVENKPQLRCTEKVCPYLFSPHWPFSDCTWGSAWRLKNCGMFSQKVVFVIGRRWQKKKKRERIRGRKWVPLFTSLSYTFQADANAPGGACIWSHVTSTWKSERPSPCPRHI